MPRDFDSLLFSRSALSVALYGRQRSLLPDEPIIAVYQSTRTYFHYVNSTWLQEYGSLKTNTKIQHIN